jgi:hypothetical protein
MNLQVPIEHEIHVEAAQTSTDGWAIMRGKLLLSTSLDQAKVVEVCNIMRGHECFECGVGHVCCFFPRQVA